MKVALGSRVSTVAAMRQFAKDRKEWRAMIEFHAAPICLISVFFRTPSRALVASHLERGEMSLYNAVGVDCKHGATTDNKAQAPSVRAKGYMFGIIVPVLSYVTGLPSFVEGEGYGILLYIITLRLLFCCIFRHLILKPP